MNSAVKSITKRLERVEQRGRPWRAVELPYGEKLPEDAHPGENVIILVRFHVLQLAAHDA